MSIDFYAEDDGTPAIMTMTMNWTQTVGGQPTPAAMSLDMAFRDIGKPVSIEAPEDVWTPVVSKRFGYSAAHPGDWTLTQAKTEDEYGPAGQSFVYVAPQKVGSTTLKDFRNSLVSSYKSQLGVAKPESESKATLGGQPALLLAYQLTNESGQKLVMYDVITVRNGMGWEVVLIDLAGNEDADMAVLDPFVASFAFTK